VVPGTLVVISIPAATACARAQRRRVALNDIEVGGEGGKAALERLRDVIGRKDSPWQPATARRLRDRPPPPFRATGAPSGPRARVHTKVFRAFYAQHKSEFPPECGEGTYERRMVNAYRSTPSSSTASTMTGPRCALPAHAACCASWPTSSTSSGRRVTRAHYHAGLGALSSPTVSFELTRYLEEAGSRSSTPRSTAPTRCRCASTRRILTSQIVPVARYAHRVPRSAATLKGPTRASTTPHQLGSVLPGEQPALIGDALRRMSEHSAHLYTRRDATGSTPRRACCRPRATASPVTEDSGRWSF